ncbi:MAG: DbpA RNA binding domain-containing protein, partial [Paracoccaceae bacterium]|nr:DbpA RNA binding domain-containing protein [Paracoccaceae bacterium]
EHPALTSPIGDEAGIAADLLDQFGPEALAAAFVRLWREGRSAPEVLSTDLPVPPPSAPRERGEFGPAVWFRLSVGRAGRAEARWLLPKICDAGSIAKDGIGAIRVREDETFVQISEPLAPRFGTQIELDKGITMERVEGEPDFDKPRFPRADKPRFDRPERRERSEKPAYSPKPPRVVEEENGESAPAEYRPKPKAKYDDRPRATASEARPDWKADRKPDWKRDEDRPARRPQADRAPRPEAGAEEQPRKPRWSPDQKSAPRSTGYKSHGGSPDKPARAAGYKSHASEGAGFKRREDGDRPARKPYAAKPEGYRPREEGERPARKPYAPKGEGFRPREDGERPKKTYAPKGDEARPFVKRDGPGKAGGFKSHAAGGKKPLDKPRAEKPRADARDTSKRFVPPKGPKR